MITSTKTSHRDTERLLRYIKRIPFVYDKAHAREDLIGEEASRITAEIMYEFGDFTNSNTTGHKSFIDLDKMEYYEAYRAFYESEQLPAGAVQPLDF